MDLAYMGSTNKGFTMHRLTAAPALIALSLAFSSPAAAQDNALSFSVTGGAQSTPLFMGSGTQRVAPWLSGGFEGLRIGGFSLGDPDGSDPFAPGLGLRGAFNVIGARRGTGALAGMTDLSTAVELGLGAHYTTTNWQVFGEIRQGFGGHRGIAGDLGANVILRPLDGFTLHAGPRAQFGNARFARTYFGVTGAEALASGVLTPYSPQGGLTSAGFEVGAYQALGRDWGVSANLRYDRLQGDAARSPIVTQGRRDQITAQFGLTRHFTLRF
jgi:MipA family protein